MASVLCEPGQPTRFETAGEAAEGRGTVSGRQPALSGPLTSGRPVTSPQWCRFATVGRTSPQWSSWMSDQPSVVGPSRLAQLASAGVEFGRDSEVAGRGTRCAAGRRRASLQPGGRARAAARSEDSNSSAHVPNRSLLVAIGTARTPGGRKPRGTYVEAGGVELQVLFPGRRPARRSWRR